MNHHLQHLVKTFRTGFLSLAIAAFAAVSFAPAAEAALSVPVKAKDFEGTLNITQFTTMNVGGTNQLAAVGSLVGVGKGKLKAANDSLGIIAVGGLIFPVAVTSPTCPILHLDLGPLNLDVLGLVVDLNEVVLDITAVGGAGNLLGNLLCAVANLLNPGSLTDLVALLNQILDLLG